MSKKIFIYSIILFVSLFIVFISCGKEKAEWGGTIEEVYEYMSFQFRFRLAGCKIAEVWLPEDTLRNMMQLGMELKPKEEEK